MISNNEENKEEMNEAKSNLSKNKKIFAALLLVVAICLIGLYFGSTLISGNRYVPVFSSLNVFDSKDDSLPKIFCLIKSYSRNYKINKTSLIYKVWGHKCDDYRFIMFIPEEQRTADWNIGKEIEVNEPFKILQPKELRTETHSNITHRIFSAFMSVYKRFPDYPWYYLVDDDSYVNVPNLKQFLSDKNSSEPVTYGYEFRITVKGGYHSGGPGYVLSNEAFTRLNERLISNYTFCRLSGIDDVDVNRCLRLVNVHMGTSVDDFGRQRFLAVNIMKHFYGAPGWLRAYSMHQLEKGYDCCANDLIAVHYMKPREVLRLHFAFELQTYIINMYKNSLGLKKRVIFKDIITNFVLLDDFEKGTDESLKKLINSTLYA